MNNSPKQRLYKIATSLNKTEYNRVQKMKELFGFTTDAEMIRAALILLWEERPDD